MSALDLVAELHPTPAVCGTPTEVARAAIAAAEPFERGGYAGPVGWVDAEGDGEWAIALRCAELDGTRARLFAGAGMVAGSEPALELDETARKFRAFLDSLRWGQGPEMQPERTPPPTEEPRTAYPVVVKISRPWEPSWVSFLAGSVVVGIGSFALLPIGLAMILVSVLLFRNAHRLIGG